MSSSTILIGIQQWTNRLKIDAIELVKLEMLLSIDLLLNTVLRKTF